MSSRLRPDFARPFSIFGKHLLVEELRRVQGVDQDAVGDEADRLRVVLVDRRDEDLRRVVGDRARREERVRNRVVVELAAVLRGTPLGPRRPQLLHRDDVLAQLRTGRLPLHPEASLDVSLHLGAEAEVEASLRSLLQLPRQHRGDVRRPRERDRQVVAEHRLRRLERGECEVEERIVRGLDGVQPVVAHRLEVLRRIACGLDARRQDNVDLESHVSSPMV